jgi:hypothetical protein
MIKDIIDLFENYKMTVTVDITKDFVKEHKKIHVEDIIKQTMKRKLLSLIGEKMNAATIEIPDLSISAEKTSSDAGFGTVFPTNPKRGDLFLRVDQLPNRLYKWNGQKWIEVSKDGADWYAYEDQYIKFLVEKVRSGEYDFGDLSKIEQEEVLKHLDYNTRQNL